jgi:hypothetical protein
MQFTTWLFLHSPCKGCGKLKHMTFWNKARAVMIGNIMDSLLDEGISHLKGKTQAKVCAEKGIRNIWWVGL